MKLFTIGDSISQGFMSLAAARTELSFSSIVAQCLGAPNYNVPKWPAGGLPSNLEAIMRALETRYHTSIAGLDWLTVLPTINGVLDQSEDFYERGRGDEKSKYDPPTDHFHNVAVWGFKIADAWLVTPKLALQAIQAQNRNSSGRDNFLGTPNAPMYRTARTVLNPTLNPAFEEHSQLRWLQHHHQNEGVENLLLFLGANNVLGTLINLDIHATRGNGAPLEATQFERELAGWNLWHPDDFEAEYRMLIAKVDGILDAPGGAPAITTKVFVGTIPLVTICPLAKGVGDPTRTPDGVYYKYYTYFPFDESFIDAGGPKLTMQDARFIDRCIVEYNRRIRAILAEANAAQAALGNPPRYWVVDICAALTSLAYKRNDGQPTYVFPDYFQWIHPPVNTKYYHAETNGKLTQGGIFSLDGVHPSAIGQGLIAHEFKVVMQQAGVTFDSDIEWPAIFESDDLYQHPIRLMREIYQHEKLADAVVRIIGACRRW